MFLFNMKVVEALVRNDTIHKLAYTANQMIYWLNIVVNVKMDRKLYYWESISLTSPWSLII